MRQNVRTLASITDANPISADIQVDERIVQWADQQKRVGHYQNTNGDWRICYQFAEPKTAGKRLEIRNEIQFGAFIPRCFGVAEFDGKLYAVIEDLSPGTTLHQACEHHSLPASLIDRLRLAWNVAKSLAWIHKAELLLETMSDCSVVLREAKNGELLPYLNKVGILRHVSISLKA
jgi:hypothetical protein